MKIPWERFGSKVGVVTCAAGFVLVFLGWNGAASNNSVAAQFPYLLSGGVAGLCFIVLGATFIIVETGREDRARLEQRIAELAAALERLGTPSLDGKRPAAEQRAEEGGPTVVCGQHTYHVENCRLLEGRDGLPEMTIAAAQRARLVPCRVCSPDEATVKTPEAPSKTRTRR